MPNQFTVNVVNNAGFTQQYYLFNQPPQEGTLSEGEVYSNVWASTPGVHGDGSSGSFTFDDDFYAACGSTQNMSSLNKSGMKIATTDKQPVTLGTDGQGGTIRQVTLDEGGIGFDNKPTTGAPAGAFMIKGASFDPTQYPYFWYGVAKATDGGEILPVLTYSPHSAHNYEIYPVMKFWVSTGEFTDGATCKINDLGVVGYIDFTGKKETIATLTQDSEGHYGEAVYTFPKGHGSNADFVKNVKNVSNVKVTPARAGVTV